jgi:hypothetical protein
VFIALFTTTTQGLLSSHGSDLITLADTDDVTAEHVFRVLRHAARSLSAFCCAFLTAAFLAALDELTLE